MADPTHQHPVSTTARHYLDSEPKIDKQTGRSIIKLYTGDWHLSRSDANEMLVTILGSCIAACVRDPLIGVGGMNHFLLPEGDHTSNDYGLATRFGVNAMEELFNAIYKAGGQRARLEVKVFGGGNVTQNSKQIGSSNAQFIRKYLKDEGFEIASSDLEGNAPRRIHYMPDTGKVMMRKLQPSEDKAVILEEQEFAQSLVKEQPTNGSVDLF